MGGSFCGLVQPPAPPQRHQVRHAPSASQRCCNRNLPGACPGLREGAPGPSQTLEPIHSLLAPTRRSVDQQATSRPKIRSGVIVCSSCSKGSRGVTPFLKVTGPAGSLTDPGTIRSGAAHACRRSGAAAMTQGGDPPSAVEEAETLGGLPTRTLEQIQGACDGIFPRSAG